MMMTRIMPEEINGPFSLQLTLESDQRSRVIWKWDGQACTRVDWVEGQPYRFMIKQAGTVVKPELLVSVSASRMITTDAVELAKKYVKHCFRLEDDLEEFYIKFRDDAGLPVTFKEYYGLRLMQDFNPFETLITGICSQNTSIRHWNIMIRNLIERYGRRVRIEGDTYALFPNPEDLTDERELRKCKLGYRAGYVESVCNTILLGELHLNDLTQRPAEAAREELMKLKGVGDKVADYVLLYGLGKTDVLPVDVWVERILRESYREEFDTQQITGKHAIRRFARERFKQYTGLAQVYLFYYARTQNRPVS